MNHFFDSSLDALTDLYDRGLLVPTKDFGVKKQPDGRLLLSLKRQLKAAAPITPPPVGTVCADYQDFWAAYDRSPSPGNYFKHFCMRFIEFDFDQDTLAVSNYQAYRIMGNQDGGTRRFGTSGIPDDPDPRSHPISFFFVPTGANVAALLAAITFSTPPPASGSLHITIGLEMFREGTTQPASEGDRNRWHVLDTEEDSIPFVGTVCYTLI